MISFLNEDDANKMCCVTSAALGQFIIASVSSALQRNWQIYVTALVDRSGAEL